MNADGARFCDACGARLEGPADAAARKTVTVVFTDLAGSFRRLLANESATSAGA